MASSTETIVEEESPVDSGALVPEEQPSKSLWDRLKAGISRNVFVLSIVSLFTDVSSEMIVPVRILFLVLVLHTPLTIAGLIEGVAESTASLLKIISGNMSNKVSNRKPLIAAGYGVANLVKPLLAIVTAWPLALGFIFLDRVGKGLRGSPRDALMADSTPREYMGKAFGFHRSMDTLGAAIGPLLTFVILLATMGDLRAVFAWTAVPGILATIIVVLFVREKRKTSSEELAGNVDAGTAKIEEAAKKEAAPARVPPSALGIRFWLLVSVSSVFALGNSSDAFIFLRSAGLEQSIVLVPLMYFGYNFVYALFATPLGALSDRFGRIPVLLSGYAVFALVYAGWAVATLAWNAWALFLLYGVYAAATEGVAKAYVADLVPKSVRGSAMGWFNGLTGLMALPANIIGGWLWTVAGPSATFTFGAWAAGVAMALMIVWLPWLRRTPSVIDATQPGVA